HDPGVSERGDGPRLALEAGEGGLALARREDLERDRPLEDRVARPVDGAHAALAELPLDLVLAEASRARARGRRLEARRRGPSGSRRRGGGHGATLAARLPSRRARVRAAKPLPEPGQEPPRAPRPRGLVGGRRRARRAVARGAQ